MLNSKWPSIIANITLHITYFQTIYMCDVLFSCEFYTGQHLTAFGINISY